MSSEDQEILAKIGKLAGESLRHTTICFVSRSILMHCHIGQINRHKNGHASDQPEYSAPASPSTSRLIHFPL
jgi:hypothetical protein